MATIFPSSIEELITFCEVHAPIWKSNAAQLGLSATGTADWEAEVNKLRGYLLAQQEAKTNAVNATAALRDAVANAKSHGSDLLRVIRGYAGTQEDPNAVYQLAVIPPPSAPSPLPPPGNVTNIKVELDPATGALTLKWKATNPGSGTTYVVRRKLPSEASFNFLGVGTKKSFTDETLPAGSEGVQYAIQGTRSGQFGPIATVSISFGGEIVRVSRIKMAA